MAWLMKFEAWIASFGPRANFPLKSGVSDTASSLVCGKVLAKFHLFDFDTILENEGRTL